MKFNVSSSKLFAQLQAVSRVIAAKNSLQILECVLFDLDEIKEFITNRLKITLKTDLDKEKALWFLDRPLRVAGVVKNEGEPGGGPYIVDNGDYCDLQICETAEINLDDPKQVDIFPPTLVP